MKTEVALPCIPVRTDRLGILLKCSSTLVGLGWNSKFCTSNKLTGDDANAASLGTTL